MTKKELIDRIKAANGVLPVIQCAKAVESTMLVQMRNDVNLLVSNVQYVLDSVDELKKTRALVAEVKRENDPQKFADLLAHIDAVALLLINLHDGAEKP